MQCLLGSTSFKQQLRFHQPPSEMRPTTSKLHHRWYKVSDLPTRSYPSWYCDRFREGLRERHASSAAWPSLGETSDVYLSILLAQHDGDPLGRLRLFHLRRNLPASSYIVANYDIRWGKSLHGITLLSLRKYMDPP